MQSHVPKTYYHLTVLSIKARFFSKEYLYEQAVQSKKFIDANFDTAIDLDAIAAKAFFSKFHFIRLYKSLYGKTPYQYLTEVRIAKAKALLLAGTPVAATCMAVGFTSTTSFAGLFKKSTGCSPAAFIKRRHQPLAAAAMVKNQQF